MNVFIICTLTIEHITQLWWARHLTCPRRGPQSKCGTFDRRGWLRMGVVVQWLHPVGHEGTDMEPWDSGGLVSALVAAKHAAAALRAALVQERLLQVVTNFDPWRSHSCWSRSCSWYSHTASSSCVWLVMPDKNTTWSEQCGMLHVPVKWLWSHLGDLIWDSALGHSHWNNQTQALLSIITLKSTI